ncbi:MAG: prepilin-type N-terminal cleavage/methylation domain-containing protein [Candidatus Paceibacterota bacterium]|jgi:prepilin-type N-terminal cleavage/methylation domain-containing protein
MNIENKKAVRGFTLVEALVAITIVTVTVSGSLFAANSALVASAISRDQLTASYLAQEGIEYVRLLRDNEYLAAYPGNTSAAWGNFLTAISGCSSSCNPTSLGFESKASFTGFTRTIQAIPMTDKDEKIVSTVSWDYHGTQYSVTITDHLTPWQ